MKMTFSIPPHATFEQICRVRNVAYAQITQTKDPPEEIVVSVARGNSISYVRQVLQLEKLCANVKYQNNGLSELGEERM